MLAKRRQVCGVTRLFAGGPKRFPLLSDRLELTPQSLTDFPGLFGSTRKFSAVVRDDSAFTATLFDNAAGLLDVLARAPPPGVRAQLR